MKVRWVVLVGLAGLLVGCGHRRPAPKAAPAAPTVPAPPPVTPTETKSLAKLGLTVALPEGWHEAPAPSDWGGADQVVRFERERDEPPQIIVAVVANQADYEKAVPTLPKDRLPIRALSDKLKASVLQSSGVTGPQVAEERAWAAKGIRDGWRTRVAGTDAQKGPMLVDLMLGEAIGGGAYLVVVSGKDTEQLTDARALSDTFDFHGVPAKADLGLGGTPGLPSATTPTVPPLKSPHTGEGAKNVPLPNLPPVGR